MSDFWTLNPLYAQHELTLTKLAALGISPEFLTDVSRSHSSEYADFLETIEAARQAWSATLEVPMYCKYVIDRRGHVTMFDQSAMERVCLIPATPSMLLHTGPHCSRRISRKRAKELINKVAGAARAPCFGLSLFEGVRGEYQEGQETQPG